MASLRPRGRRWPTTSIEPSSGVSTPRSMSRVVVLPAPFGPSSATRSPEPTARASPSTAGAPSKRLGRPDATRAASTDPLSQKYNRQVPLLLPRGDAPLRTLALVDGEHYPAVVRAALAEVPDVVGAALLAGGEKLAAGDPVDLGVPVVHGDTPDAAVEEGLRRFRPELVVDLSDQPVTDGRTRLRLAARVLVAGVPYQGADFRFDPPPRPRLAHKP